MSNTHHAVEMKDIVVRFPGVLANDRVNLTIKHGEIHALLGENGAGKSTMMNALAGLYKPASGSVKIYGESVSFNSPKDAIAKGIGMVHQHFTLVPVFTVAENMALGRESRSLRSRIAEAARRTGFDVDPDAIVADLSVGEKQRVEILRHLIHGAEILILDEPTSGLDPRGREEMLALVEDLAGRQKKHLVLSTHLLPDVEEVCSHVVVLDSGRAARTGPLDEVRGGESGEFEVRLVGDVGRVRRELEENGSAVTRVVGQRLTVRVPAGTIALFRAARDAGAQIRELRAVAFSLEQAFLAAFESREAEEA